MCERQELLNELDLFATVVTQRMDEQGGDSGFGVGGEPLLDEPLRPHQGDMSHQLVGYCGDGLGLLAAQVELLDLVRHLAETVPGSQVVVEVLATRAHAADVK